MAPRYRKIDPRIWNDEKFRQLTPEEQRIALYVLTAQSNRIGFFIFSQGKACEDLRMPPLNLRKGFQKVCQTLNWEWDSDARVLYLPTWWRYNKPENANNVIGNLKDLDDLPETQLLERFSSNTTYLSESLIETFTQTLAKRSPQHSPKRSPSQEQEQEQEQDQEQKTSITPEERTRKAFVPQKKCAHQFYRDTCEDYAMPGSNYCKKHKAILVANQKKHGVGRKTPNEDPKVTT